MSGEVPAVVVAVHPGPEAQVRCATEPGPAPALVVTDAGVEVVFSPAGAPSMADLRFAERLLLVLFEYVTALHKAVA